MQEGSKGVKKLTMQEGSSDGKILLRVKKGVKKLKMQEGSKGVKKLTMQKAKDRRMAGKNQNRNKKMKKKGRN